MYYFIQPKTKQMFTLLESKYMAPDSSDISDIIGWALTEEQIKELDPKQYKKWDIPEQYQDNIELFRMDYWDGDFSFEKPNYVEVK